MAGQRERSRMPGSVRQQYAYGTGDRREGFFAGKPEGRGLTEEEWGRFPALEGYKDRKFVSDPEGVMIEDVASRELEPFRESAGDVEMSDDEWAAFEELIGMAAQGEGSGGEGADDPGFFRRIIDLLSQLGER